MRITQLTSRGIWRQGHVDLIVSLTGRFLVDSDRVRSHFIQILQTEPIAYLNNALAALESLTTQYRSRLPQCESKGASHIVDALRVIVETPRDHRDFLTVGK